MTTADFKAKLAGTINPTGFVEGVLRELIQEHGIETVQDNLRALYPRSRHSDSERLRSLARNVNNQINRQQKEQT